MPSALSIKIGDLLYRHAFPVYNVLYPVFKKRQDKKEIELLKKYIKKGDVVLDIGANIGFYTKILSALVGDTGKVYAFEPDVTNFSHLKENTARLKNVELHNKAVSATSGTITLYKSTLLNVDHKTYASPDEFTEQYEIPCAAMDDIIPAHKVDFIKIDIQGYEYFAFKGMQQIFNKNPQVKILTEFYPHGITNSGISVADFFNVLWENQFKTYWMQDEKITAITSQDLILYDKIRGRYMFLDLFICKDEL